MFTVYRKSLRIRLMQSRGHSRISIRYSYFNLRRRNRVPFPVNPTHLQKLRVMMRSVRRALASRCCSTRRRSSLRVRLVPRSEEVGDRVDSLRSTVAIRRRKRATTRGRGRPRERLRCRSPPPFPPPPPPPPRTSLQVVPRVPVTVAVGGSVVERCCSSENVELHCENSLSS